MIPKDRITIQDLVDAGACVDGIRARIEGPLVIALATSDALVTFASDGEALTWIRSAAKLNGDGSGDGYGDGSGDGYGYGYGYGYGDGYGSGYGYGDGYGSGYGDGYGSGYGD